MDFSKWLSSFATNLANPITVILGTISGLISAGISAWRVLKRWRTQKVIHQQIYLPPNNPKLEAFLRARHRKRVRKFILHTIALAVTTTVIVMCIVGVILINNLHLFYVPLQTLIQTTYKGHNYPVQSLAWSPRDKYVASSDIDGTLQVWDALSGNRTLLYHDMAETANISSLSWSPDGKYIAFVNGDGYVQVLDTMTNTITTTYKSSGSSNQVAWSPNSLYIASSLPDSIQVWNTTTKRAAFSFDVCCGSTKTIAWSHGGRYLGILMDGGTVQIWDTTTKRIISTYQSKTFQVVSFAWSPSRPMIVCANSDGTITVWDTTSSETINTFKTDTSLVSVGWSPDDSYIAYVTNNGLVQVIDEPYGGFIFSSSLVLTYQFTTSSYTNAFISWSPGAEYLAISDQFTIQVNHISPS